MGTNMRNKFIGILVGATAAFSFYRLIMERAALTERLQDWENGNLIEEEEYQDICGSMGLRGSPCCPSGKYCHLAPFHEIQELRKEKDRILARRPYVLFEEAF